MMTRTISQESFSKELFSVLEETFETHHGIYLDKGTSLFETLSQIGADEASIPVGDRLSEMMRSIENWEHNDAIGDSMAIVVHTAYHLGEIRQALCTVGRTA
jgi:hypothetical protein